ncbi:hypothetical protein PF008_g6565 [Phytophthora fragariae]|uniref:B30.2/SPRY domain-containing protein n=1 Tax=Phytophthora fragariae TaxID=53985 RepID=A0A6G0S5M3_9STRA|nr:hypothetical protein PF008_g6565 [Phytophthora fragariae]
MEAEELDPARVSRSSASAGTSPSEDTPAQAQATPRVEAEAWGTGDDEDGWMPKPARLHSGRTRCCAVCFASLQYSAASCWDEYLQSDEYLRQLQANVLQDAFVSSLLCGENAAGDLPTEHRMHKNRKLKCRQSVADYRHMTSAGVVDRSPMDKGSVRTLEEMLIEALPTPVFTHVLERRLAVISHSSKIACELMRRDGVEKISRPVETAPNNEELHHLAIHTLSALLGAFDYKNPLARRPFEELSQLLTCFPVLSLYAFWSPTKKAPDKVLLLERDQVEASSVTTSSDAHGAYSAVDGVDSTSWQSQPRPGSVHFAVKSTELPNVTSIAIHWHAKYAPQTVGVQYRVEGRDSFVQLVEDRTVSSSGPTVVETNFPPSSCETRIVMSGLPSSNRNGAYAIEHLKLKMPAPGSLFADPKSTLSAVAHWLLGALDIADEVMAAEAIGALRAWALSTASLSVTMLFVDMLLRLEVQDEDHQRSGITALALDQGRHLYKGINAYHREESQRLAHGGDEVAFGDVRKVAATFESSVCSTGVLVEDGGLVVRTRETSYQYAAVNCGISSGKASWKFRLDTDTQDDEMTCFGAAILPVTVSGYDSSPNLWMLRGYNGNLYARGHKLNRTIGKVHPGDIVQIDVDMGDGTLAYKINGTDYGVVFTDLAGHERFRAAYARDGKHAREGCVHILGIISANLESISCHDVKDPSSELGMSPELVGSLRRELETMACIREESDSVGTKLAKDIEKAAARTIVAGISVLYPSASEKLELLLQLLQAYIDHPFEVTSANYFVLTSTMELLAAPGPDRILTFMPFVAAETEEAAWSSAVTETVGLLMKLVVNSHREQLAADADSCPNSDWLPDVVIRLLKTYQLYLLSEAVELTKTNSVENDPANPKDSNNLRAMLLRRLQVQEATIQFGFLSLNAYRDLIDDIVGFQAEESFVLSREEAARQASVRSYKIPLLSEVLPWFVSSLCLLRRQTWLARPILPAVVRLLETVDHYCSESQIVSKSAHRFQQLEAHQKARLIESQEVERAAAQERDPSFRSHTSKRLYNVFHQLYTGEKDHFEGQIGFQFEATSSFSIVALGRSVNPTRHGGRLTREHTIRLWEERSQLLLAQVTVGGSSKKDAIGYALEMLPSPAKIIQGKLYRLTTQEFANGGDPWYKKENLPDEEYDESFIKILRDCYASGSVGFPGSQNMMGAAYGVPTFMVQDETPLASLPRFVPPHGCLSLRFNAKKTLNSVCVSHTGTSAYVKDGTDTWRTCLLRTAFLHGVHSVDFALKSSRAGGSVSGHICIGIDWRQPREQSRLNAQLSAYETFMGETATSIGWMPSIGAVWVKGKRYDYGPRLSVSAGDIFTITIDYDLQLLAFAYNGKDLGVAVGPKEFRPRGTTIEGLPQVVTAGVSLYGSQDVVQVRSSGIAKSTLRIHWLFDLHNLLASLAGRITSTLIAGHPVDGVEEELLAWLQSPLLSGGVAESLAGLDQSGANVPLRWNDALQAECARYPANDGGSGSGVLKNLTSNAPSSVEKESILRKRVSGGRLDATEGVNQRDPTFWGNWTTDMTERGTVQLIMSWLEKHCPDRTFMSRLGRFPSCERWMCAALIMHAPFHVIQEVQAIAAGTGASTAGEVVGADFFLAHANLSPSDDLVLVWKRVLILRHWLIKTRQEYRAKEADDSSSNEKAKNEVVPEQESDTVGSKRLSDNINLEQSVVVPKTFDELVQQVIHRAEFLCKLAPPSEEAERIKGDSQVALLNLAEKWSAQKTPPSLQPMLERWKTLGEADSSKWSGIVDVLRAQHRWRARRASIQALAIPTSALVPNTTQQPTDSDDNDDIDASDDVTVSKKYDYTNSFSAMMKACELYIRDGTGAPPEILALLLERRQRRSDSRLFGLQAMKSIISLLSYDSAIHNALIFLRPAMRGFTDSEKESRELNDGQVVAETFRATVRHHYLKGLEGCNRQTIDSVQGAFCDLYAYLAQLLGGSSGYSVSDPQLKQTILCAWSLDFEPRDHQFLLDTGMLSKLQEIFSISSVLREAVADNNCTNGTDGAVTSSSLHQYSSINWHPLSEEFVQQGLLQSGYMTKRDVIRLLRRAPHYACSAAWWKKNELDLESATDAVPLTSRHTASSLSLLYADMLAGLQRKLLGPPARTSSSHALLFGDDDDDVDFSDSDDAYVSEGQIGRGELVTGASQPLDAAASKLILQWNACTDEQMIIRKQTRRCAWVVFRFLASTGISGAYERREGEAKSVAAFAKQKRKQRLQKAGSSGNVAVVSGLPSAEASRAPGLSFTEEDVAARTAEAASDAAKSAATNRELEEPVLQTLWFSKEFHRKVFEVLEKELIQGKELTEEAEGLTRAQRMLRSVSTPVQKRGASLRQYPSDVGRGKSGFVSIHHAPSDLTGDIEVLEPLEVETHMFSVLLFMLSQSQQSPAITYLVRPHMLRGLLEMLRLASPRSQRVVKLLLRRICCSGSVTPSDVGAILGSESVLIDLLLDQVAESVCSTAAPMPTHAVNVPPSSALVGTSDRETTKASTESLSNPIGFRSGQISLVVASESVALLRRLLMEKKWQQGVAENLCNAIRNIAPTLARKKSGPPSPDVRASPDPSDIRFRAAIIRAVGALCVLGSHSDCVRVGGKVAVAAQGPNSTSDVSADGSGQSVSATLIEMNSQASTVRVVFHPTSSEVDFDPSHNIQDVKLSAVSPTEEVCLPPTAVPLTMDMMPVILQLSSLDETSVLKEFDSLWRLQIRSRALLALEALLRHSLHVTKSFAHDTMAQNLLRFALTPISLSSFLTLPLLQERGRMILCRLIESSTPLGEAMFRGLRDPTPPALPADSTNGSGAGGVEANDDPAEEETEAHRVRRGFASTLAAMGFEFDLCMAALEHSRDDPNLAVEWLMGDGAATYQERQQAQRLAQATIAAHELADGTEGSSGLTLEAKASELQNISGMPYCLAFCALELSNSDPNRAMEWLMEHGSTYAEKFDSLDLLTDTFAAARTVVLEDRAAMEEIDQPDPLVTTSDRRDAIAAEYLDSAPSSRSAELSYAPNVDSMAVTLAPILAPGPAKPSSGISASRDASMTAFSPLDPEYLTPNVLLTVTSDVGPVQRLATSGRTGIYRRFSPDDGVLITFLNTESGAYEDEWHFPRDLRRIVKIYDEPLEGVESIHRVALRTENALSTYYARRAITALLCAFDSVGRSTANARRIPSDEAQVLEDKPSSLSSSFSSEILSVMGGPRQFVSLLKMVAASEMNSTQHAEVDGKSSATTGTLAGGSSTSSVDGSDQSGSLLASLQNITLRMLREEARTEKFEHSELSSSNPRPGSPKRDHASAHYGGVSEPISEHSVVPEVLEYGEEDDDDEALNRAIAMSIEAAQLPPAPVAAITQDTGADWINEESKSEDASVYKMRRTRQPSDTEAQEVASAYLGGGIDDHDGLLSSVLVKECVSHFVESTRMAGDGAGEAAVQEFQSLHPYFGRCEYARAVSIDSSYRCLRIVFDHRCRLGPKAKLIFYADPECEDRIGVVDNAMTTSDHLLPDLIIHSHQFWFRFNASEENATKDNGYGYRFQVKPMASIRWTKESEVLASPSLEWACWVLELLLNDATELVAHGAVHNRRIYGALVRYLRSPGAPFKGRVVRLLQQLLYHPELFPADEVPELDALESISRLAVTRAEVDRASGKVFLSAHLLQLVELSMMISSASSVFERKLNGSGAGLAPQVTEPFELPVPFERKRIRDSLNDVSEMTRFLLGQTTRLPQHVLVAIWLEVYGSSAVIETSHPYTPGASLTGHIAFDAAQALRITFDSRCSLASGQGQTMSRLELASFVLVPRDNGTGEVVKEIRSNRTYAGEGGWPETAISHDGNNLEYKFHADENAGAHFGFAATVNALGIPKEKQLARATVSDIELLLQKFLLMQEDPTSDGDQWTQEMDLQLVDWVNNHVEPAASLPSSTPATIKHSVDLQPADIKLNQTLDGLRCSQLLSLSLESLQLRFALLKYLNLSLQHCLPLLDLRDTKSPWTIAHRLRQLSHCIFFDVKSALVEAAIEATNVVGETSGSSSQQQTARITLDRMQALESRDDREVEPSVSECFFAQAFRQLNQVDPALLRRQIDSKGRLFSVKFRGEEGVDWGGVYREGATSMVDDLFSPHFSLFVLCPNGQHDTGNNRGMYLPNPKCTSPVAMQMFTFVGQLLGISLRTHGDFPFMLASLVWKQLLGQTLTRSDLEGTDAMFIQMLDGIANCEKDGIFTEEEFATAFAGLELRFTASSCTGEEIELVPGGRHLTVEFHNRLEYYRLAERARLEECSAQVAAMARGFATLFPRRVLTLLTWQELETLTCGSPKIDLDLWQRHTRYDGYSEDDPTVQLFWEVLGEFSDEQRADFVRFAWGRSRLPRGKWPQPFKLSKKGGRDATRSLPVAHTCFFSVELPPYTSRETMHSMLLATITFGLGGILMA